MAAEVVGEMLESGVMGTLWEGFDFIVGGNDCCESRSMIFFENPVDDVFEFAFFTGLFMCLYCAVDVATHFSLVFGVAKVTAFS